MTLRRCTVNVLIFTGLVVVLGLAAWDAYVFFSEGNEPTISRVMLSAFGPVSPQLAILLIAVGWLGSHLFTPQNPWKDTP